jgi:hypothetical protein
VQLGKFLEAIPYCWLVTRRRWYILAFKHGCRVISLTRLHLGLSGFGKNTLMKYCFLVPSGSWTTSFPVDENELPPATLLEMTFAPCGRADRALVHLRRDSRSPTFQNRRIGGGHFGEYNADSGNDARRSSRWMEIGTGN